MIHLWLFFLITPPAVAVGAFLNHPFLGFICGAASGLAVALWAAVVN